MSDDGRCLPELRGNFTLENVYKKIEHEKMGNYARIEINQNVDNADQKVKWFLKVHKTYKLLWQAYFQFSFFPSFYSGSHFTNFSIFTPLKRRVKLRNC